jgi:DNA-binding CsgD family transcriptional regulator/MFS family permease
VAEKIRLPRISITVSSDSKKNSSGELNTLSIGYGIHQSWIYAMMFGAATIFQSSSGNGFVEGSTSGPPMTSFFLIWIVTFSAGLFFCSITDQKFLHFYVSKRLLVVAAVLTSVGTLAAFGTQYGAWSGAFSWFAGITAGIGSCLLVLYWAVAYSRNTSETIIVNTAVAIFIAIAIYSIDLHWVPFPLAGIITALLPLLEVPFLWQHTPIPYSQRHEVPIFNPLPIKRGSFSLRLGVPVFIFGFALGALRTMSLSVILPANDIESQLVIWVATGLATLLTLGVMLISERNGHWDLLFRALLPFIAVSVFALAFVPDGGSPVVNLALLIGYMCFEALMWIFFGEVVQEFRISPIFTYGLGRGLLAFGSLASSYAIVYGPSILTNFHLDKTGEAFFVLLAMVVAYALLPRQREIAGMINMQVSPTPQANDIARINEAADIDHMGGKGASDNEIKRVGWFRTCCEAIANRYLLSHRELEVLFLLAKGYNASYIQEKLYVSRSTAKTHINHIYRKLGIHSQQELLAMIEAIKAEGQETENDEKSKAAGDWRPRTYGEVSSITAHRETNRADDRVPGNG